MYHLLLVEDEPDLRLLFEDILASAGYKVDVAPTVAQARTLLGERRYDLVICDGTLPDGNGLTIADEALGRGSKAIILTGYASALPQADIERHEVLPKPIRPAALLDAVERRLGAPP